MRTLRQWGSALFTRSGIVFMQVLAAVPLPAVRGIGTALGWFLYLVVGSRRRVVDANLLLCFPVDHTIALAFALDVFLAIFAVGACGSREGEA